MYCICSNNQNLPSRIQEDLTLTEGTYHVKGVHYVQKGASLNISEGVTLLFEEDAIIRVDGSIKAIGSPNNLINITSSNPRLPGTGLVVNGVSAIESIDLKYVRFNYMKKPISFEFRWSRESVNITECVFKNSNYEGAAIEIKEIDNLLTPQKIQFNIVDNTFSNNTSSILISNITSDLLSVDVRRNVITRNEYTGRRRNGIFTSPVFMTYNSYQRNDKPVISDNSIFDNFFSLYYQDTFDVGRTNISVIGNASQLDLSGNYFGDSSNKEIEKTFDYTSANYQAPYLFYSDLLPSPPSYLNGHFYHVEVNEKRLDETMIFSQHPKTVKTIEMKHNRSVRDGENFAVIYHYLKNDSVYSIPIRHQLKWSSSNTKVKISLSGNFEKLSDIGYLEVSGLYDSDGMDVPILFIGKKGIVNSELRNFIPQKGAQYDINLPDEINEKDSIITYNPNKEIITDKSLISKEIKTKSKYYDYGFFIGNSMYFGDVNTSTFSIDPRNMRPNGGLRFGYQISEKLHIGLQNNYMIISGSDQPRNNKNPNARGTTFERNISFRTTIIDACIMLEYNLLKYKSIKGYVPSLFIGSNAYYFKPMAQVNDKGTWYDLRSIGTEGQTIDGAQNQYDKIMYGIPFGAAVKRHLKQNVILSLSYTYTKIFTDYLDDVSTGFYPDPDKLIEANPDLGETAVILSNPGNQTEQRSYSDDYDGYGYWGFTITMKIQ